MSNHEKVKKFEYVKCALCGMSIHVKEDNHQCPLRN